MSKPKTTSKSSVRPPREAVLQTIPYELKFETQKESAFTKARLLSPLLDPNLFPKMIARIEIATAGSAAGAKVPALDQFAVESLREFLRNQPVILATIEAKLSEARLKWDRNGVYLRGDIWKQAKVILASFNQRRMMSPGRIRKFQTVFPAVSAAYLKSNSDTRNTRSSFTIAVEVPWADDHPLWLFHFRDKQLTSWGPDG